MRLTAPSEGAENSALAGIYCPDQSSPGCTGIPHFIGFLGMARGLL